MRPHRLRERKISELTLDDVQRIAAAFAAGRRDPIDLTALVHGQRRHQDIAPAAVLAWWLLSARPDVPVLLPDDDGALLPLARAGLLFALTREDVQATTPAVRHGKPFSLSHLTDHDQLTLDFLDWAPFERVDQRHNLLAVRDLERPSRIPPPPALENRRYTWLDAVTAQANKDGLKKAHSVDASLWRQICVRFNGDADQVLYELVSNVHRWAFAETPFDERRAVGVCSLSRGLENRLHIVVMDSGRGIPSGMTYAQRVGRVQGADWRDDVAKECPALADDPSSALLHVLTDKAHLDRNLNRLDEGCGLFVSRHNASRHQGSLHLLTVDEDREDTARAENVLAYDRTQTKPATSARLSIPGASGTIAIATLVLDHKRQVGVTEVQAELALAGI